MNVHRFVASWLLTRAFAALGLLLCMGSDLAQPPESMAEDQRMLPYAEPGQRVDIGGRRINLECMGANGPTVVLMSGIFSWSLIWYKTQAVIAQKAHVCAFDRANYGFSDPTSRPQLVSEVVEDLHKALQSGSIQGPYVLVGHSLGGLEARLYAERWPREVAGMVIVDTSPAGEGLIDENDPDFDEVVGRESYMAGLLHCALLESHAGLDPSGSEFKACSAPLPSDTPAALRKVWPQFFTAYYFADKASLMSSLYTHRYDSADHHDLGAIPLIVLSAENSWGTENVHTPAGLRFNQTYLKTWIGMHEALAHLSSRGIHRLIKGSGHSIQLDKPQAVIDAVDDVLGQLHGGTRS